MTDKRRKLQQLHNLSALMLDARLTEMQRAATAREASRSAIAALTQPKTGEDSSSPSLVELQNSLSYQSWADHRRRDLSQRLARQTADWLICKERAQEAFGRKHILKALEERSRKSPPRS